MFGPGDDGMDSAANFFEGLPLRFFQRGRIGVDEN